MSDNQRRAIFRVIFLLTCFLPTGVVGYWICHPQTANGWERAIQAELGITTEIDSVVTPGPYVTILTGLKFSDPEGTPLFETVEARIDFGTLQGNGGVKGNRVVIPYKVQHLSSKGLSYLVDSLKDNVVRKQIGDAHWKIVFEEEVKIDQTLYAELTTSPELIDRSVTPLESVSSLRVVDLVIDLGPATPDIGTFAEASFLVVEPDQRRDLSPVNCKLSKTERYGNCIELDTNGTPLPCWLLADSAEMLRPLGPFATFNGGIVIEQQSPSQQRLEIAGVIREVDLGRAGLLRTGQQRSFQSPARIDVIQCVYDRQQKMAWNVVLFPDQDSELPGIPVRESDLFNYSKQIDIANAFSNTLLPLSRAAANDSNFK